MAISRSKNNRYSTDISVLANYAQSRCITTDDPSVDVLMCLAAAYAALDRLSDHADLEFSSRTLVLDNLVAAYREALFVRSKRMDTDVLNTQTISKFGRLNTDGFGKV